MCFRKINNKINMRERKRDHFLINLCYCELIELQKLSSYIKLVCQNMCNKHYLMENIDSHFTNIQKSIRNT